jgi:hypothetical protein
MKSVIGMHAPSAESRNSYGFGPISVPSGSVSSATNACRSFMIRVSYWLSEVPVTVTVANWYSSVGAQILGNFWTFDSRRRMSVGASPTLTRDP